MVVMVLVVGVVVAAVVVVVVVVVAVAAVITRTRTTRVTTNDSNINSCKKIIRNNNHENSNIMIGFGLNNKHTSRQDIPQNWACALESDSHFSAPRLTNLYSPYYLSLWLRRNSIQGPSFVNKP